MRRSVALNKIKSLLNSPSFTSEEAKACGVSAATLAHYIKSGKIVRIGRGIYRGAEVQVTTDFRWEDLVEAVRKTKGGIICLVSALALYDITEEIPRQFWIAVNHKTRHRADRSTKVVRMRNIELGKTEIEVGGTKLPIFDRERTIVDSFRFLSLETAIKALRFGLRKKGNEKIDLEKIADYARKLRVKIDPYIQAETT